MDMPPANLLAQLPPPDWSAHRSTAGQSRPAGAGAYILVIGLSGPTPIRRPGPAILPAGWYLYAGSAFGPGGMAARIARHLSRPKKIRWHVDQLTATAGSLTALAYPGAAECLLMDGMTRARAFQVPITGFGSSDCRACTAHLAIWTGGKPPA